MFSWLGRSTSKFIWRRVLNEHPQLLELFLPGNEDVLARVRASEPKLEDAIKRFGPPPHELVAELLNGPRPAVATGLKFEPAAALSTEQLAAFFSDGYLHVKGAVAAPLVAAALRHVNSCLGRGQTDRSLPLLTGLPTAESAAAPVLDLFVGSGSSLPTLAQSLLGIGKVRTPQGGQVALRFPVGAPPATAPKLGGKEWHIDGFGDGQHSPFTLLVGVCLSDTPGEFAGNFAVQSGAHWSLQSAVKDQVSAGSADFSRFEHADTKPDLGEPTQLRMQAGDVVLAHQKLPHLGVANNSPHVRYQVYFRVQHTRHENLIDQWLDDLMMPFEGVKQGLSM